MAYTQAPADEILSLREQGLTDNMIFEELKNRGMNPQQIYGAIAQANSDDMPASYPAQPMPAPRKSQEASSEENNIYERIEEITENLIDEKWDELIGEVRKIVEWKEKVEERQTKLANDVQKLKEDFVVLHQGVLGKLEDYDTQMRDVGTELKAVGKVFKDVIPEFVENVKELKSMTKKKKE